MSVVVKFVKPTTELIEHIAVNMRQADADEVWASSHHTPIQSLVSSLNVSYRSAVITVNDEPCVMLGLAFGGILSGNGTPWLLGVDAAIKHKREFLTEARPLIDEMLNICPRLSNYVHAKNTTSIRWLKRIGFIIEPPVEYGVDRELFHPFYLERV